MASEAVAVVGSDFSSSGRLEIDTWLVSSSKDGQVSDSVSRAGISWRPEKLEIINPTFLKGPYSLRNFELNPYITMISNLLKSNKFCF